MTNETRQVHNTEAERQACEIRLRAERKAGELLRKMPKAKGGQPSKNNPCRKGRSSPAALTANCISHKQSSQWQKLAAIPEQQFEASNRQIAKALGIDEKTVRNDAAENSAPVITGTVAAKLVQRKERAEEQREENARERRREQQRRHRQRQREGRRAYLIELDGEIIDMLVRYHWLSDGAAGDDQEVGCAVRLALLDVAKLPGA